MNLFRKREVKSVQRVQILPLILLLLSILPIALSATLGVHLSIVLSGSMKPIIQPGDALLTKLTPVSKIHTGQVIVYYSSRLGMDVAHRVVAKTTTNGQTTLTTKGDSNPLPDESLTLDKNLQLPVNKFVVPKIGYVFMRFQGISGKFLLLILFGLTFGIFSVVTSNRGRSKSKAKIQRERSADESEIRTLSNLRAQFEYPTTKPTNQRIEND